MNNLRNKVQLIGHIGQTPEVTTFENGNKVAKLTLATNESYKNNKGEKITDTQWHQLEAWGKTAEIIEQFVKKGHEIAIDGKLSHENYKAKNGTTKYVTKIKINEILMLGNK